jgi:hypothetical protein
MNKDRKMHFDEYVLAQLLVARRLKGDAIPSALPTHFVAMAEHIRTVYLPSKLGISYVGLLVCLHIFVQ